MKEPVRIAVLGAGLIGQRHIQHVKDEPKAELVAIVDPTLEAKALAESLGVKWSADYEALLKSDKPDGAIIATPNLLHLSCGLASIEAGVPALVEKPIADDVLAATRLVEAAEKAGVPLLVGHHRRYNPLIRKAKEIIDSGRVGRITAVNGLCWFLKPDDYFDVAWRREPGGGPVLLNLIHVVDDLRNLCGEVVSVQAVESSVARGFPVEDTAAIVLRFQNGALGTISISDAVAAPWSWELTAGENPAYPHTDESCYLIGGTRGSLTVPQLDLWYYAGDRSWWAQIEHERVTFEKQDPLVLQVRHFCEVIQGKEKPLVSGREGLQSLKVTLAVKQAAATGGVVRLS